MFSFSKWLVVYCAPFGCCDHVDLVWIPFLFFCFVCFSRYLRWAASVHMSGTPRNQRKAPQSWGPLTNHLTSLASSTLCGSRWELSCNRAATSLHGEGVVGGKTWALDVLDHFSVWVWLYVSAIFALFKVTQKGSFPKSICSRQLSKYVQNLCKLKRTKASKKSPLRVQWSCPQRWKF